MRNCLVAQMQESVSFMLRGEKANNVLGGNTNSTLGARNGLVLACPSTQRGQVRVEFAIGAFSGGEFCMWSPWRQRT